MKLNIAGCILSCWMIFSVNYASAGQHRESLQTREEQVEYIEKKNIELLEKVNFSQLSNSISTPILLKIYKNINNLGNLISGLFEQADGETKTLYENRLNNLGTLRNQVREILIKRTEDFQNQLKGKEDFLKSEVVRKFFGENPNNATMIEKIKLYISEKLKEQSPVFGAEDSFSALEPDLTLEHLKEDFTDYYPSNIKTALANQLPSEPTPIDVFYQCQQFEENHYNMATVNRFTGYTFTGTKADPDTLRTTGGFIAPSLKGLIDLSLYIRFSETYPGFISTSRSIRVSIEFASRRIHNPGEVAYVYSVLVNRGLDATDDIHLINTLTQTLEQEISVPGFIPWGTVVAYRKVEKRGGNPAFVGPVFIRNGWSEKDPVAFKRIYKSLSLLPVEDSD